MAQAGPSGGTSGGESFWRKFWENWSGVMANTNPSDSVTGGKVNGSSYDHPPIPGTTNTPTLGSLFGGIDWKSWLSNPVVIIIGIFLILFLKKK